VNALPPRHRTDLLEEPDAAPACRTDNRDATPGASRLTVRRLLEEVLGTALVCFWLWSFLWALLATEPSFR
jgi:hypothetical protein